MEDMPVNSSENTGAQQGVLIFLAVLTSLCIFVFCGMLSVAYGINVIDGNQRTYLGTQAAMGTNTAISQSTQVAEYRVFDDFNENRGTWDIGDQDNKYWRGNLNIQDGIYSWDIAQFHSSKTVYSWRDYFGSDSSQDFDMSVDARLETPEAHHMCYGTAFRSSSKGQYMFSVCDEQIFFVKYNDGNDQDETLLPWTHSPVIRPGEWNTLAVRARGDHFVLSINNLVVFEFSDERLSMGSVALMLNAHDDIPGTILFDNFGLQPK